MNFIIKLKKHEITPKTLLLIRLDAIGDYILFRNFIEAIRKSDKYKGCTLTLCGNMIWQELSENFDSKFIDEFIWIDRNKFANDILYKYLVLKNIYNRGFEAAIEATYSREILFGDSIIKISNAKERIGSSGSPEPHAKWKRNLLSDRYYTKLIPVINENLFEFEINKEYFKNILEKEPDARSPFIITSNLPNLENINNKYVVIIPGVSEESRRWASDKFKEVAEFIMTNYQFDIVLSGSKQENYLFEKVVINAFRERFINYFGCTLTKLAKLIADAKLLISNDTSAVHFAAAVDTPFICIANGFYYGRFNPYPKHIFDKAHYIFPKDFLPRKGDSVDKISPLEVKSLVENILNQ